jgi:hypothetical protein
MQFSNFPRLFLVLFIILEKIYSSNNFLKHDPNYRVTLFVYSGTPNPEWKINQEQFERLKEIQPPKNTTDENKPQKVMGYQGFLITDLHNKTVKYIKGNAQAEHFLLKSISNDVDLPSTVSTHVIDQINSYQAPPEDSSISITYTPQGDKSVCEKTPLRGPDTVPNYDPANDNQGCYILKQRDNNCYNYGTDVLTNTYAQPGRGTKNKWQSNTCEDVKRAAVSDGLEYIGRDYPKQSPDSGHYLALLMWPGTNFHWLRLDSNGFWSHKPGWGSVIDRDNQNKPITDPSIQDFSPWTEFCGYYKVKPSTIIIN